MSPEWIATILAVILGIVNLGYLIWKDRGKEVWHLADRLNEMEAGRINFKERIMTHVDQKCEVSVTQFGETIRAQIEHIRLLELDLYKNFVRVDTFKESLVTFTGSMNDRLNHFEKRFDRLEEIVRKP